MLFDFVLERYPQIIATVVTLILFFILKRFADSLVNRFGQRAHFPKARVQLVKKYIDFLLATLVSVVIVSIWGVKPDQIFLFISSILTVIGVAFFAQWSILSNVTAGIIIFFSFPFKIGDKIRILDKECPIEAEIKEQKEIELKPIPRPKITVYPAELKGTPDVGEHSIDIRSEPFATYDYEPGSIEYNMKVEGSIHMWTSIGRYDTYA